MATMSKPTEGTTNMIPGSWKLIGTQEASSDASLTQTGLDATYDTYVAVISDLIPGTDDTEVWMRLGDSGGVDSGASDYAYHQSVLPASTGTYAAFNANPLQRMNLSTGVGSASTEGFSATVFIGCPSDATAQPHVYGISAYSASTGVTHSTVVGASREAVITMDRVQILMESGNIASGRFSVYGVSHV